MSDTDNWESFGKVAEGLLWKSWTCRDEKRVDETADRAADNGKLGDNDQGTDADSPPE